MVEEKFNVFIKTTFQSYNILDINHRELDKLIKSYNEGEESVFLKGKKNWLNNLMEIQIYTHDEITFGTGEDLFEYYRKSRLLLSFGPSSWIPASELERTGKRVTENYITEDYGFAAKNTETVNVINGSTTMKKIFISHSSKDANIVEKLVDLLEVIGIPTEQIFCSSFEGYGIALGENFLERLKTELNNDVTVLFVLTKNFYESPICLCEMGATWIKTTEHIPVIIPPFDFADVKGVIPLTQGLKINDKQKVNSLKEKLENVFSLKSISFSVWERRRDKIINDIQTTIDLTNA